MRNLIPSCLEPWLDAALNFVYPPVCQICGQERAGAAQGFVCAACRRKVRWVTPPFCERCGLPFEGEMTAAFECANCQNTKFHFRFARSAVVANDLILDIIHRYKYSGGLWFERFLAGVLIQQAVPALSAEKWDLIVPIPLHHVKERERQFNQAEHLARHLGRATGLPVNVHLVKRVKSTTTQTLLGRRERAANVQAAFAVRAGKELEGEKIVLLDDVLTTGATTNACARALRGAGAGDICVWTIARGA
jgi:ComF family protein